MKLIVGLGNPGKQYERTRHNVGFLVIDEFRLQIADFSDWKPEKKFNAHISEGTMNGERVLLAKPQTYMNNSGQAVASIARFYKIDPNDVWIVHDDLDLPLGTLRVKQGGGSAGHNGVQSVAHAIGKDFWRFRLGIGKEKKPSRVEEFVLGRFGFLERRTSAAMIEKTTTALQAALQDGIQTHNQA